MSADTRLTMENPLYEAQRALFQRAVQRAHQERASVMRRVFVALFGGRRDDRK